MMVRINAAAAAAIALFLTATVARADVKLLCVETATGLAEHDMYAVPSKVTMYFKGDKYREDLDTGQSFIYNAATDRCILLNTADKTYAIIPFEDHTDSFLPGFRGIKIDGTAEIKDSGSTKTIVGKPAHSYLYKMTGNLNVERGGTILTISLEGEQWATDALKVSPKQKKLMARLFARGIARRHPLLDPLYAKMDDIKGVPLSFDTILKVTPVVASTGIPDMVVEVHSRVKGIRTTPLPASLFLIPKGYRAASPEQVTKEK